MSEASDRLRTAILALTAQRAPNCPSDAARAVDGELARAGDVVIPQKGTTLDPDAHWRGPVRITARIEKL